VRDKRKKDKNKSDEPENSCLIERRKRRRQKSKGERNKREEEGYGQIDEVLEELEIGPRDESVGYASMEILGTWIRDIIDREIGERGIEKGEAGIGSR